MAFSPAPLPSLALLSGHGTVIAGNQGGDPAPLPHLGLVLPSSVPNQGGDPAPLPHLGLLLGVAAVTPTTSVGAAYDEQKKKRYIVKRGDKLVITTSVKFALKQADEVELAEVVEVGSVTTKVLDAPKPDVVEIPIADIKAQAALYQQEQNIIQMFKRKKYEEALNLFEALRSMQDEEDVELLLMSL